MPFVVYPQGTETKKYNMRKFAYIIFSVRVDHERTEGLDGMVCYATVCYFMEWKYFVLFTVSLVEVVCRASILFVSLRAGWKCGVGVLMAFLG